MEGEKEKGGERQERERKGRRGERKRERAREERERERGEGGKGRRRERERKGRAGRSGECTRTWHCVTDTTTSNSLSNNPGISVNGYHCETPSIH